MNSSETKAGKPQEIQKTADEILAFRLNSSSVSFRIGDFHAKTSILRQKRLKIRICQQK